MENKTGGVLINVTVRHVWLTIVAVEKCYECVYLFLPYLSGMKIMPFLCRITLLSLACRAVPYRKEHCTQNVCFDVLYTCRLKNFSVKEFSKARSLLYIGLHLINPVILVRFYQNLNFLNKFAKYKVRREN